MKSVMSLVLIGVLFNLSVCSAYYTGHTSHHDNSALDLIHHSYKDLFPDLEACCPTAGSVVDEYHYVVFLHYINANGISSFPCTGALISHTHVLTAAHCVTGPVLDQSGVLHYIRLGTSNATHPVCPDVNNCQRSVTDRRVASVKIHRKFIEPHGPNDIALIRLEEPVTQFTSTVRPICLRWVHKPRDSNLAAGHTFTVVGRRNLKEENLSLVDFDECEAKYAHRNITITDRQLCVGGNYKKDTNHCEEVLDGSIISNVDGCAVLDGISSFAKSCDIMQWPAVYTDVNSYKRWILRHLRD